jgi:hypothetical protein
LPLLSELIALPPDLDTIRESESVINAMRKIKAESGQISSAHQIQNTDYHSNVIAQQPCSDRVQPSDFLSYHCTANLS